MTRSIAGGPSVPGLDLSNLADNTITRIPMSESGSLVAVAKAEGRVYVFPDRCPHGRARLSGGTLDGSVITCPVHGMKFDLRTGRPVGCRAPALRTTEVTLASSTEERPAAARLARRLRTILSSWLCSANKVV